VRQPIEQVGVVRGPGGKQVAAVSVIVPTVNRVEFLARAIESVLAQTYHDLEIVVVVDGPSPAAAEFVLSHPDPRVRLVQRSQNGGVAAARNSGVEAANGRYIGLLDDDDLWLPHKLANQVPLLDAGADVVHSLVYVTDGNGDVYEGPTQRGFRLFREVAAADYPYVWLLRRSSYYIGTFVIRRACFDQVGGFDPDLAGVDDLDLVHRLRRCYKLTLVDEPLSKWCMHGANSSLKLNPDLWIRLANRELAWVAEAAPPDQRAIEAYLYMQIAQSAWIAGRYRSTLHPALRAHHLDASAITARTLGKYLAAAFLPARLVRNARARSRSAQVPTEPDPWLDLPTRVRRAR
jgi:glycosyltransferase involved in cell wall biosynthesis